MCIFYTSNWASAAASHFYSFLLLFDPGRRPRLRRPTTTRSHRCYCHCPLGHCYWSHCRRRRRRRCSWPLLLLLLLLRKQRKLINTKNRFIWARFTQKANKKKFEKTRLIKMTWYQLMEHISGEIKVTWGQLRHHSIDLIQTHNL